MGVDPTDQSLIIVELRLAAWIVIFDKIGSTVVYLVPNLAQTIAAESGITGKISDLIDSMGDTPTVSYPNCGMSNSKDEKKNDNGLVLMV